MDARYVNPASVKPASNYLKDGIGLGIAGNGSQDGPLWGFVQTSELGIAAYADSAMGAAETRETNNTKATSNGKSSI